MRANPHSNYFVNTLKCMLCTWVRVCVPLKVPWHCGAQSARAGCLLLPCGFQVLNSICKAWLQALFAHWSILPVLRADILTMFLILMGKCSLSSCKSDVSCSFSWHASHQYEEVVFLSVLRSFGTFIYFWVLSFLWVRRPRQSTYKLSGKVMFTADFISRIVEF